MQKVILYFVLLSCIFGNNATAQISQNNAADSIDHLQPRQKLTSIAIFPDSHNRCEITSGCFYSNVSNFECDGSEIVISSTCVTNDESNSDPYCFTQNVGFVNRRLRQAKSFIYYYEKDSQKYIHGAKCIKADQEFYVELENTNLGNCKICEWSDYFDKKGEYIGSENGRYGKTSFPRKSVPMREKKMFQKGRLVQRINITTIAQ